MSQCDPSRVVDVQYSHHSFSQGLVFRGRETLVRPAGFEPSYAVEMVQLLELFLLEDERL